MTTRFALIGAAGFVAPRHMEAIRAVGGELVAALDPHDSVGVLDKYGFDTEFFTEYERFERHLEMLARSDYAIDVLSVCSPNYLHDSHVRLGLRTARRFVICEKPLTIEPHNLNALYEAEFDSPATVRTILQLRHHPEIMALAARLKCSPVKTRHDVVIDYSTPRGSWYDRSWKGDPSKSGGVLMNIGVHLFDLAFWLFGRPTEEAIYTLGPRDSTGNVRLDNAHLRWDLSTSKPDARRVLTVDGEEINLSTFFSGPHTVSYAEILAGGGWGINDARPAIEFIHALRHS